MRVKNPHPLICVCGHIRFIGGVIMCRHTVRDTRKKCPYPEQLTTLMARMRDGKNVYYTRVLLLRGRAGGGPIE